MSLRPVPSSCTLIYVADLTERDIFSGFAMFAKMKEKKNNFYGQNYDVLTKI